MSRKRAGRKNNGNLEFFYTLRDLCADDQGWYDIFDESAQGIFRRGVKFIDNRLIFKIRGKGKPLEVPINPDANPEETLEECKAHYRKMNIKTLAELKVERKKEAMRNEQGFAAVKSPKDRQHYIERYIERRAIIEKLTEEQCLDLQHTIFMGLMTGAIGNSDIKFVNNRIEEILFE